MDSLIELEAPGMVDFLKCPLEDGDELTESHIRLTAGEFHTDGFEALERAGQFVRDDLQGPPDLESPAARQLSIKDPRVMETYRILGGDADWPDDELDEE